MNTGLNNDLLRLACL
uniref:Uncharacterized protein n=1 Tax=Anguilla anguilla TaxID=7936 RepID=A0A0E9XDZ1_ANGAN